MKFDANEIRKDFPIFNRKVNGKNLIYLDSASTSQKPSQVIDAIKDFYEQYNSNVHRSVYKISEESTENYEKTREKIKKFINAKDYEIIFTKNCTEAINLVSHGWAEKFLENGDSVLLSMMEHHSNIVPWQVLEGKGIRLKFLDINEQGELVLEKLEGKTRIVSLTHISNVLGTINDVKEISKICHENNSFFLIDGAQSVPHTEIDLEKINCDFIAFSGHKMLGPTGVGILAVKKEIAEEIQPVLFGSDMIREVTMERTILADPPLRFEAGTPNVAGVIGLSAAIDYLSEIGMKDIEKHERELAEYAIQKLSEIEKLKLYGPRKNRSGIISFNLGDAHSHDLATILDDYGIAIRSGHHCAQILMRKLGVTSMARASFYIYNTKEDVDTLVDGIKKAGKVLKI